MSDSGADIVRFRISVSDKALASTHEGLHPAHFAAALPAPRPPSFPHRATVFPDQGRAIVITGHHY